jgi:hypothetical protein
MPNVEVTITSEIEVEVYCGICGEGICRDSTVEVARGRADVTVTARCLKCEKRIAELEEELNERMES